MFYVRKDIRLIKLTTEIPRRTMKELESLTPRVDEDGTIIFPPVMGASELLYSCVQLHGNRPMKK
jgi:hypothetical protein